ncbi:hypothetical protein CsSME_00026054 [Camellia sinensis var. sinensis]
MSEMMKNPRIMRKAQAEVRQVFNGKGKVDETGIQELNYFKRICPGMAFGLANLPGGMNQKKLDLTEAFAVTVRRKEDLNLIAVPYKPIPN